MLGTSWKCWGHPENVGDNLKMLGTFWKCWGHPENVGDKLKMFGKFYIPPTSTSPPYLGPLWGPQRVHWGEKKVFWGCWTILGVFGGLKNYEICNI